MSKLAKVIAVVFVLIGILGFIPNPIVGMDGMFETDLVHNLVHILLGVLLFVWPNSTGFKLVGIIYLVVAILGFVMGEGKLLGLVHINAADNWLHLVLGVVLLALGFMGKKQMASAMSSPQV